MQKCAFRGVRVFGFRVYIGGCPYLIGLLPWVGAEGCKAWM